MLRPCDLAGLNGCTPRELGEEFQIIEIEGGVRSDVPIGDSAISRAPPMKRAEAECTIPTPPWVCHSWNFRPQGA